jgi:hypothetical protein
MTINGELAVVVEGGMLRPENKLNFPEHTRLVITIRRVETTPEAEAEARRALHEIRERGELRLGGWHPTRDEMHERH